MRPFLIYNPSLIANAEWPSSKINIGVNSLEQHQILEEVIDKLYMRNISNNYPARAT